MLQRIVLTPPILQDITGTFLPEVVPESVAEKNICYLKGCETSCALGNATVSGHNDLALDRCSCDCSNGISLVRTGIFYRPLWTYQNCARSCEFTGSDVVAWSKSNLWCECGPHRLPCAMGETCLDLDRCDRECFAVYNTTARSAEFKVGSVCMCQSFTVYSAYANSAVAFKGLGHAV